MEVCLWSNSLHTMYQYIFQKGVLRVGGTMLPRARKKSPPCPLIKLVQFHISLFFIHSNSIQHRKIYLSTSLSCNKTFKEKKNLFFNSLRFYTEDSLSPSFRFYTEDSLSPSFRFYTEDSLSPSLSSLYVQPDPLKQNLKIKKC